MQKSVLPSAASPHAPATESPSVSVAVQAVPCVFPEQAAISAASGAGGVGTQPSAVPSNVERQVPESAVPPSLAATEHASAATLPEQAAICAGAGAHKSVPEAVDAVAIAAESAVLALVAAEVDTAPPLQAKKPTAVTSAVSALHLDICCLCMSSSSGIEAACA
ncbi:MAG TPA: hypothetical protein VGH20_07535 [Myxococcales bacterium]